MFRKLGDCAQALGAPHEAWAQLRCRRRKLFIAEELRLSTKLWPPFGGGMLSVALTPSGSARPDPRISPTLPTAKETAVGLARWPSVEG